MNDAAGSEILALESLSRRFGEVVAVDALSLALERGEILTILGPSGCGKTTALRLIAGFEQPDSGRLVFEGKEVTRWSPQKRGFGMVFQNYALFPHLNVFENVAFGLRARKVDGATLRTRVLTALKVVDLSGYEERAVQAISGGQQQRVALARAIAIEPPILLLDEPLSNLDQALRARTRVELRDLVKSLGITALFVTHDQEEAFDLSDRIAVMKGGRLRQVGTPRQLYQEPRDVFVAGFVGRANLLSVHLADEGIELGGGVRWPLRIADGWRGGSGLDTRAAVLLFRPEDLTFIDGAGDPALGTPLRGEVRAVRFRGSVTMYEIAVTLRGGPGADSRIVEVVGPTRGPGVGSTVAMQPRVGARLHLFAAADAEPV